MSDVIWVLIITWVVYQLYNSFKKNTYVFNKTEHHHYHTNANDNFSIDDTKKGEKPLKDDGEYVDFEEIK